MSIFIYSDSQNFSVSSDFQFYSNSVEAPRQFTSEAFLSEEISSFSMEQERIQFPKGKQKEFIAKAKSLVGKSWNEVGQVFDINTNTFQSYWKERTRLSKKDFEKICNCLNLVQEETLSKYAANNLIWDYNTALMSKNTFGKDKIQTKQIKITYPSNSLDLDLSIVNFSKRDISKRILLSNKITPLLAEEIGLSIGDGYISNKKFEYRLKGNKKDEKEYYNNFVKPMFKELYNIDLNIREYDSTVGFELYSKALWEFKTKVIGLPTAPKRTIGIPALFKVNNKEILCSLVRGLFDTDGNIYFRSQGINKSYYPVLSFTTISKLLAEDLNEILAVLGFNSNLYFSSKITKKNPSPKYSVVLYGYSNFRLYKKLINTRQPKNINKLKVWGKKYK